MTTTDQLAAFHVAKHIALTINAGFYRRARYNNVATPYGGFKDTTGRMWVIADSEAWLQNPDALISTGPDDKGHPAREIFGEFTVCKKESNQFKRLTDEA